jgi:hypothetical protein
VSAIAFSPSCFARMATAAYTEPPRFARIFAALEAAKPSARPRSRSPPPSRLTDPDLKYILAEAWRTCEKGKDEVTAIQEKVLRFMTGTAQIKSDRKNELELVKDRFQQIQTDLDEVGFELHERSGL